MTTGLDETHPDADTKPTANELIKDVQKTLLSLNEDELTREDFEPAFLYEKIAEFMNPTKLTVDDLNKTGDQDEEDEHENIMQKKDDNEAEGRNKIMP